MNTKAILIRRKQQVFHSLKKSLEILESCILDLNLRYCQILHPFFLDLAAFCSCLGVKFHLRFWLVIIHEVNFFS